MLTAQKIPVIGPYFITTIDPADSVSLRRPHSESYPPFTDVRQPF